MTTPFVGEIQILGFNYAPSGWALCNGATVQLRQFTGLFSLIGVTYGGNGTTTFQLPNLASRAACSQGTGPGLSSRNIGEPFGEENHTLTVSEMPQHNHTLNAFEGAGGRAPAPANGAGFTPGTGYELFSNAVLTPNTTLSPLSIQPNGGSQPHPNQQPYLAVTFAIALNGVFPAFN